MKHFTFRLDRVLALRERLEQERARELAHAVRDELARRHAVEEASERLDRCCGIIARLAEDGVTAGVLRTLGLARDAAATHVDAARAEHASAVSAVEDGQSQFVAARQDRRSVERLREIRHAEWFLQVARHEQSQIDEIVLQRHARGEKTR
ncbi:MAG: flagellar export protein FliJ [Gemmatimonadales bacterium]